MSKNPAEYYRYLAESERDRAWQLWVTGAGYQPAPAGADDLPHRPHPPGHFYVWQAGRVLQEFAILYVTHGRGEFESEPTGLIDVEAGDVILLFPGRWHRYRANKTTGWGVYWVHFLGEVAEDLLKREFISPQRPVLRIGLDDSVLSAFNRMLDDLRIEPAGLQQILAAHTLEILARALGTVNSQHHPPHSKDMVRKAKLMLDEDPDNLPVIEDLISGLDVGRTQFFNVFKEQTGLTPYQYHLQLKLRRAGDMLRNSDLPIKQISNALRFQNPYHFSQLFKRKTGLSPTRYRQRGRKP